MKSFKFLIILLLLSVNSFAQKRGDGKTEWSPWTKTCFANLYVSIKCNGYSPEGNDKHWMWNIKFKNTGNQNSHFSVDSWFLQTNERFHWGRWDLKANSESTHTTLYYNTPPPSQNKNISDFWGFKITRYIENPTDDWTIKSYACNGIYAVCDYNCNESNSQANSNNSSPTNQNSQNSTNTSQNSTGSTGTSSMNRSGNESTGWNGNNGNSNNNYNQQIQNQNSKTTEAFDLYNSTGNYEEARRKLIEAKNNAPDEASRQVAQQNIDKLDKVERKNQNVETISKTIDFTTDLIKTIREQKEKNILAQIEQSQKERMEKYELYSNKLLVQLEKINNLESNTKTYDDYKILIKDFKELKKIYQELYYSVPMNDMVEYKIKQDYFKVREKESQIRFNKTLLKMYESGYLLNHNEIDQIIDFSNFILISNIIDILKNNPLNDIGKSSYEIAYLSNKTVSHILSLNKNNKIENKEDINTYLKYFLDNEYKYLEISNNNNYTDASFKKNIYLLSGWYNLKPDINTAISNLQILVNSKKINERYTSKGFYQNCTVDKIYSSYNISLENVKAINSLFIEESGKASVAKKIKQEFDKALISFGYNTIPSDDYNKKSPIFYKNIGEIYFDSNGIDIRFSSLENAIIFKNFNVYFYLINEYDKTNYFFPTTDLKIIKNEINTHNYFFKLITNQ